MLAPGFEWMVAWRHLRDPDTRSHRTLITGVVFIVLGALAVLFAKYAPHFLGQRAFAPGEDGRYATSRCRLVRGGERAWPRRASSSLAVQDGHGTRRVQLLVARDARA